MRALKVAIVLLAVLLAVGLVVNTVRSENANRDRVTNAIDNR